MTVEEKKPVGPTVLLESGEEVPRCNMCKLPAFFGPRTEKYSSYCGSVNCKNRERLCQACGGDFVVGIAGAGTKYCSTQCKFTGYRPDRKASLTHCAWCGKISPCPYRGGGKWPYICAPCIDPIKHVAGRLKDHNVSPERARMLLTNPGCEVCGSNLLERVRTSGRGKVLAALVVDHDHQCCPSDSLSCGKCVRGLLCYYCNWAAGQLRDNPDTARSLANYLERWKEAL